MAFCHNHEKCDIIAENQGDREMRSRKLRSVIPMLLALILTALLMTGCEVQVAEINPIDTPTGDFPITVGGVEINAKPTKVYVASASLADVVIAIGAETQLVAGAEECTQPELEPLAKVSADSVDELGALSPNLIIVESGDSRSEQLKQVAQVVEIQPATGREDFERLYGDMASVFMGGGIGYETGIREARRIFTTLDDIERETTRDTVTTACYLYDTESRAITGDMFTTIIMDYSGLTNSFGSQTNGQYDSEVMKLANPNVIFCATGVKDQILTDTRFTDLTAVKEKKVYELDSSLMEWQGRTVINAALNMSALAFPELMAETTPEPKNPVDEINSQVESQVKQEEEDSKTYTTLQKGDNSEEVNTMQTRLTELGYLTVEYDGQFGDVTEQALKDFETKNGLTPDGIADTETLRVLYSDKALKKSDPDPTASPPPAESGVESAPMSSAGE